MKRTTFVVVVVVLVGFMLASFIARVQPPLQAGPKSFSMDTQSGYRIERVEVGDSQTCIVIVSKGNAFSAAPCR